MFTTIKVQRYIGMRGAIWIKYQISKSNHTVKVLIFTASTL